MKTSAIKRTLLLVAMAVTMVSGSAAAVNRLVVDESAVVVDTAGNDGPAYRPDLADLAETPALAPSPISSMSTTTTSLSVPHPATGGTRVAKPAIRQPVPVAPSVPSTIPSPPVTVPPPPVVIASSCPGVAPVISAYGIYVANAAGTVRRVGDISGDDVVVAQMSWSPDGALLAFSTRQGNFGEMVTITVVGRDGLDRKVLESGTHAWPTFGWSTDSRQLIHSVKDTNSHVTLMATDARTGTTRSLIKSSGPGTGVGFVRALPDGQRILTDWSGLSVVGLDGGGYQQIATGVGPNGTVSPDGRFYAFSEDDQLNLVEIDTGRFTLGSPYYGGGRPGGPVRWSPDSRLVAYTTDNPPGTMNLNVARLDGTVLRTITGVRGDYRFSPEGDRIAAVTSSLRSDIYRLTGPDTRPGLVNAMRLAWAPSASLTGIEYFFDHPEDSPDGTAAVCAVNGDGSPRRLVTFIGRTQGNGLEWCPDGQALAIQVTR